MARTRPRRIEDTTSPEQVRRVLQRIYAHHFAEVRREAARRRAATRRRRIDIDS